MLLLLRPGPFVERAGLMLAGSLAASRHPPLTLARMAIMHNAKSADWPDRER